ncbi:MAG: hypothetical protein HFE54_00635 [Turicibacter sp.]|uniref:Cell-wall binding lipoprotein n=1 Tax=Turicibacter faecis TaxID=2963365 RepID=A0ABN6ZCF4_9FIRM|nr:MULTISPECIES: YkyA family protein [unclassified Turicibacter]MCI8702336.1 hypothetical protein [Turicibacter sp.]BEH90709.1 hypothetical protein T23_08110 [Turicibacter sp. TC023]MCI9350428.1 hypothetical protein [Turicibacter sp.]MCU7205016.1 YkyA family protein [Turicibacter sp. TA25]MCU7210056.1 YkyA family protein [Turicibacter sp. 1E2]
MKKLFILVSLCITLMLMGCQGKTESKVFQVLNEHIKLQNECNRQYETLTELFSQETVLYNQLMDQGFEDFEQIKPLVDEGSQLVKEIESQLQDYQTCVDEASLDEKELGAVDSEPLNQLVSTYQIYEQELEQYTQSLISLNEAQQNFYEVINDQVSIATLDERITAINLAIDEANTHSMKEQEALENFNQLYKEYGKMK